MAKFDVKIQGTNVSIDTDKPRVAEALKDLIEACAVRRFYIGQMFLHSNGCDYLLSRILQPDGTYRAYLINMETGVARNSRKVVKVLDPMDGRGYVETLPAEKDMFFDPQNPDEFLDY